MLRTLRYLGISFLTVAATFASADVRLPSVFSDRMVLQRGAPILVWGWADPGEAISVTLGNQTRQVAAGTDGKWRVDFGPMKASGEAVKFEVAGKNRIAISDVLIGEVWVCSGQSNMEWPQRAEENAAEFAAQANFPTIRMFTVEKRPSATPESECKGSWAVCSPATVGAFSAVGYHFAQSLHAELKVPIGMIHTSWGGTPAEAWTRDAYLMNDPLLKGYTTPLVNPTRPSPGYHATLYNGMIAPLIPYRIKGAIWYQGESNVGQAWLYRTLLPTMIKCWRTDWTQGDFPFGIVQIAPYPYGGSNQNSAELREAQLHTAQSVKNTGMAVTMDIGNPSDIHPTNKNDVGKRLALWALATQYRKRLEYSGPVYKGLRLEGSNLRLFFHHVGEGLSTRDGKDPSHFEIAGADGKFVPAQAKIEGKTIVVRAEGVAAPTQVRYGWLDDAQPNMMNSAGLPASSFRSESTVFLTKPK